MENCKEIIFENKYTLTKNIFMEWGKENAFSGKHKAFAVYWVMIAIVWIAIAGAFKMWIGWLAALFCVYRGCVRWMVVTNGQYKILSKQHGGENWTRRILFQPDNIQVMDGNVAVQYKYTDITNIKEKGNYIKLVANNGTVIRMYENGFVDSTWEECKKFICEKMNYCIKQ